MSGIRYADAGMDMKKWILMLLHRFWMVLAAAAAGAVLGGIIYTVVHTVPESEREYRAVSKVYLDFATDETGETPSSPLFVIATPTAQINSPIIKSMYRFINSFLFINILPSN